MRLPRPHELDKVELSRLDAHCLRQLVLKQSQGGRWAAQLCRTALRMFLRFLIAEGYCRSSLLGAIPVVPHWRLSSLPRYLPSDDVERLIDSCDRTSPCDQPPIGSVWSAPKPAR